MSRWTFIVGTDNRAKLHAWLERAPMGMIVQFIESKRTQDQNSKLWPMLTDISTQLLWHGMKYPPEDWKDYLMHQLRGGRWMPAEEGGMVPVGFRTSELTKEEFSGLIEVIYAFGARHDVVWSEPKTESTTSQGAVANATAPERADAPSPNLARDAAMAEAS